MIEASQRASDPPDPLESDGRDRPLDHDDQSRAVDEPGVEATAGRIADDAPAEAAEALPPASRGQLDLAEAEESSSLDGRALWALGAQHVSSTISDRSAEFALYLFLISLFPTSLLPSSLFGFFTTGVALIFSGPVGALVDSTLTRLALVRRAIFVQKISVAAAYASLLVLILRFRSSAAATLSPNPPPPADQAPIWLLFALLTIAGCILKLSTICLSVAIERDWVTTIASGSGARLTRLNVCLRRIDLGAKLLCPLFVSLLSSIAGDAVAVAVLLGITVAGLAFELLWIRVVWKRWRVLAEEEASRLAELSVEAEVSSAAPQVSLRGMFFRAVSSIEASLRQSATDWKSFTQTPIFPTSLAISLLYFTVLSFDGTMISWLKSATYADGLIAGMRGLAVVMGLLGTVVEPWLEARIGVVRTGGWAIWSEVLSLVPVLLSFFIHSTNYSRAPAWNQALLFGGMALSRVGLWSFDLCQLKQLQTGLHDHPRRNALSGLQYSLQNTADLGKFVLTIVLSRPTQFRYAAAASFGAVLLAALVYSAYMRRERGHLVHLEWTFRLLKKHD